jgi:hypothetical protein
VPPLEYVEPGEPLREHHPEVSEGLCRLIGVATVVAPALHLLSDVLEILAGGFYSGQLWETGVLVTCSELVSEIESDNMLLVRLPNERR